MKSKQLTLIPNKLRLYHGGRLARGKRKRRRTLCSKRPIHLVLKSNQKILFKNKNVILQLTKKYSERFGVKIYQSSVQKNHIHYILKMLNRQIYIKFIRSLTSQLAKQLGKGLWSLLPFTRITEWGKPFRALIDYVQMNEREVLGLQEYRPRKDYYKMG